MTRLWRESVGLDATEDELTSWSAAAMECVDALRAAGADFWPAQLRRSRWRDWPLARRWAQAGYDRAAVVYLERVRAAASAYQPVRDVVEHRIAELEAGRRTEARRLYEEQERRREEAEARFREWERRQETADLPLPGGRTPRKLAAAGERPASWPSEVVERVGDVAAWWAGVRAGAVPLGHLLAGTWHLDLYLPDQVLFVASSAHRDYHFAIESTEHVGYSTYTRKVWWQRDSADFVRSLFPVSATYTETYGSQSLRFPIADHADPAAYGPYVEAVAAHVAAAVRALLPDRRPP